jgi:hypothetical protein
LTVERSWRDEENIWLGSRQKEVFWREVWVDWMTPRKLGMLDGRDFLEFFCYGFFDGSVCSHRSFGFKQIFCFECSYPVLAKLCVHDLPWIQQFGYSLIIKSLKVHQFLRLPKSCMSAVKFENVLSFQIFPEDSLKLLMFTDSYRTVGLRP